MLGVALAAYRFVGRVRGRSLGQWTSAVVCGDRHIYGYGLMQTRKHTYNIQEMLESIRNSPMSWIFEEFFGVDTGLGFNIWRSACQQSGMDLSHDTLILKKMDPCMTTSIDGAINGFQKPTVESRILILQQKLVVWNFPVPLAILRTWPFWDGLNGCWWPPILGIKRSRLESPVHRLVATCKAI